MRSLRATVRLEYILIFVFALLLLPQLAFADSATYSTPGTYTFTVPAYGSLTVTANGAGGGSGASGVYTWQQQPYNTGGTGSFSAFGSVVGYGGGGGGPWIVTDGGWPGTAGTPGSASGGDSNITGGGAAGGAPTMAPAWQQYSAAGGSGGRASKTYASGSLSPGSTVSVTVGSGGAGGYKTADEGGGAPSYYYTPGNAGSSGSVSITWTAALATCAVTLTPSTVNEGTSSTLSWTSSNADTSVYINNVGYVSTSGSTSVSPSSTTDYSCQAQGAGGTDGWHEAHLTVHPSCTFNSSTVTHGSSVTGYLADSVAYDQSCTSQTRTCTDGTLSGSYAYSSCTVTDPLSCTLDGATVAHEDSRTFYSQTTNTSGSVCSSVSQSRSCTDGTLSGSSSYSHASCSCTPVYSCSTDTIQYLNSSCTTSNVTTCDSPAFCSAGSSVCLYPPIEFISDDDSLDGHLTARPLLVPRGLPIKLYWNVDNVSSCTISGGGQTWTGASSGSSGQQTANINQQTTFALSCTGLDNSTVTESTVVNILPVFNEN